MYWRGILRYWGNEGIGYRVASLYGKGNKSENAISY
jgi:hypothetical protein